MTDIMGLNTGLQNLKENNLLAPLPAGVHPNDPTEVGSNSQGSPAPDDTYGSRYSTGAPPWKTKNDQAFPVFQRASSDWTVQIVVVNSSGEPAVAVGRQKGRQSVTLSVPTTLPDGTTPNGVLFAPDQDPLFAGTNAAGVLNPGDSTTINTEAPVWVYVIPGNLTGAVQVVVEYNPPGGALGAQ